MENEALVIDMLEWVGAETRDYHTVMAAWRTSCPRLTIWEDALDAGYVRVDFAGGTVRRVSLTPIGRQLLQRAGRGSSGPRVT